jgi:hypothetical protein
MERAGLTADDVAQRLTVAAREGQPEFRVMDALGIPGARRASGVVRAGEEGSEQIRAFLEQRQAGQGDRVAAFIGDAFDGGQTAQQVQTGMRAARDQIADAQYAAARAQAGPVDVRGALQVIDDYIGPMQGSGVTGDGTDAILSRFRARLAAPSSQLPSGATSVELSDFSRVLNLKRDVQDAAEAAFRAGRGNEGARLNDLWRALDASLEASSPAYRAANDAYRESSRVMGAIETGQEIATRPNFRAEDVADTIARMTPEQQAAARVGFGDRALARIDATAGQMTNRARPFLTPRFEEISNEIGVDPALLMSRLQRENAMFATNSTALGGSRTADNLADAAGVEGFDSSVIANLLTGRFGAAAGQVAGAASDFFSGVTPNTRMLIAEALLSNDVTALRAAARRADVSEAQRNIIEALMRVTTMQQGGTVAGGEY